MNGGDSRSGSFFLQGWRPYFWLITGCFFIYLKTLTFYFTYFDDNLLILENYWFLRDFGNIFKCLTKSVFLGGDDYFYRPVMLVSLMLDAHIGGKAPLIYHFTNILLHSAGACLVFRLFKGLSYGREKAFFTAMLFMAHPVLTQAVAWIPGRNDSLFAVFALLAFISYIRLTETPGLRRYVLHLLFLNIALYTKETALMLIPAGILYSWMVKGERFGGPRRVFLVSGWSLSAVLWMTMRYLSSVTSQKLTADDITTSIGQIAPGIIQYLGKLIMPFNLSVFPIVKDTSLVYGCAAVVLIAAMLLSVPRERLKRSLFGLAWFLMFILPPFILPDKVRLEHRLYVPIIGFFMILAEVRWPWVLNGKKVLRAAGISVIALFSAIAFVHSDNFIGRLVFWKSAVRSSPHSSSAHNGLALRYLDYGEKELSETELLKALELTPGNVNALTNLGIAYTEKGMYRQAEREFKTANSLKPNIDIIYYNYGLLAFAEGRDGIAREDWLRAIELNPNYIYAYRSLAAYYYITGNTSRAEYYAKLLKEKFAYDAVFPAAPVLNKRGWLYLYCKQAL